MTLPSAKRIHAIWVLLCWLWFSAAAPFAHQCAAGDRHVPGWSSAPTICIACDWAATSSTLDVAPPPEVDAPVLHARVWIALPPQATRSALLVIASRGPPSLA
jgi:hypothetical protein